MTFVSLEDTRVLRVEPFCVSLGLKFVGNGLRS